MYAPFGAGVLIGPRATFADGDPFLAGGGAVDLVDLDEVIWTDPPEREEAGSPNVIGAVALHAAIDELAADRLAGHRRPRRPPGRPAPSPVWPASTGFACSAPTPTSPPSRWRLHVDGVPHALVAARLSAEYGIGVRHGCFCAHPYLLRLLGLAAAQSPPTARRCEPATAGTSPARSEPAPGSTPGRRHRPLPRSRGRDRPGRRRSPTCRTPPPATTGPKPTRRDGPYAIRVQVPRARETTPEC